MKEYKTKEIRNISIIGSAKAGKTSLGEALLFSFGKVTRQGRVADGSSSLDYEIDEIQHKASITSSLFNIETSQHKLNFLDTPGKSGFVSQVITAVHTCESSLVVLNADAGVEVLTKKVWALSKKADQAKFIFINKMDKERVDLDQLLDQVHQKLSAKVYPLFLPLGEGDKFNGVIDIIKQKVYVDKNNKLEAQELPAELKDKVAELRSSLMEAAAESSEDLLNKYLKNSVLTEEELIVGLRLGVIANDIIPLMLGASEKNIGIKKLAEYLNLLAPNPLEKGAIRESGDPLFQIFKITDDAKIGEFFFFKVYRGELRHSQELIENKSKTKERIGHLFVFNGKNREEIEKFNAGDIGATAKLKSSFIGATLYAGKQEEKLPEFKFPEPLITQAVKPESEKDNEKLGEGLQLIHRLDPCFISEHSPEFNELVVSAMSKSHIDIMAEKIKAKYKIKFSFVLPQVSYRETISSRSKAQGKYKKQSGGHGQYGDCWIEVLPTSIGAGYEFVDNISGGVIPSKYIPSVEKGVKEAVRKGVLAGYPMVDIKIRLYDGSYHSVDSSDLAFQMAGILALKKAAEQATPVLLEPVMSVKVTIPEEYVGDISADFNQRRGKVVNMEPVENEAKIIHAYVPQAEMAEYLIDLKSMTKGEGIYTQTFEKYEQVPTHIAQKIVENRKKEKEKV
jgi:elongation factor G